ncbi:MAG: protein tyrosine phosphatase [Roseiflexus castenholzii]|uniref:arsenate reductase/protein-tyrosine-phosphatase family protein n=1 Tax=Roseiflexus castenholzii TaxID=120962 RepID=UPI000CB16A18|nr:MAG: protein tyrosine phosphatase [Roseiflexus castenholzii]
MMDMTIRDAVAFFRVLADPTRCAILVRLARSDERPTELSNAIKQPLETIAAALADLESAGLITSRPSDAGGERYYHLDLERLQQRYAQAGGTIHPALAQAIAGVEEESAPRPKARVLFLCTHNSARSQMAEGLMRAFSHGSIEVFSAGSQPTEVHPLAIETMDSMLIDIRNQRSKHYEEFVGQHFDYVITVCDRARETCPVFPGLKESIHWSIPDPATVEDEAERRRAFHQAATQLANRIRYLQILIERGQNTQSVRR